MRDERGATQAEPEKPQPDQEKGTSEKRDPEKGQPSPENKADQDRNSQPAPSPARPALEKEKPSSNAGKATDNRVPAPPVRR
jgi:hypothetical protein